MRRAAIKLRKYLKKHKLTDEKFAEMVGCSIHAVRKYKGGSRRAEDAIQIQINLLTGIGYGDWLLRPGE